MEGERRRPFFVTLLAVQYGLAGLGNLTGLLYVACAAVGAGNFGLYVMLNTALYWIVALAVGVYLFATAKGLYDMKGYGWKLALIGSVFWMIVSAIVFLAAVFFADQYFQVIQPPDVRPMVQQMLAEFSELIDPGMMNTLMETIQGLVSVAAFGIAGIYYLVKGFFLFNAVYNGIVTAYLVKIRRMFREPAKALGMPQETQAAPPPQGG